MPAAAAGPSGSTPVTITPAGASPLWAASGAPIASSAAVATANTFVRLVVIAISLHAIQG